MAVTEPLLGRVTNAGGQPFLAGNLFPVDRELDAHPNMMADIAARVPEIGRHDPAKVRRVFEKHHSGLVALGPQYHSPTLALVPARVPP